MKKKCFILSFLLVLMTFVLASCGEDIPTISEDMIEVSGISDEAISTSSKKISFTVGYDVNEFKVANIKIDEPFEAFVYDVNQNALNDNLKLKEGLNTFKLEFKYKDTIESWTLEITREKAPVDDEDDEEEVTLASIEVSELQESYFVGDTFVPGKLKLKYSDDTTKEIDLTLAMVSGFDTTTPGSKTLTITYEGKTTTKEITVLKANSIGVKELKSEYYVGDEFVPGKLNVCKDGVESVIDLTLAMVTGFTTEEAGEVTLTIKHNDLTITHKITVKEHVYTITVKEMELDYYVGEDFKGGKLTYTADGAESEVDITLAMVSGFSTEAAGNKEITITYKDLTLKKTITVSEHVYTLEVKEFELNYYVGDDFKGGTLTYTADGVEEEVEVTLSMVSGFNSDAAGDNEITITYKNATLKLTLKVTDHVYEITEVNLKDSYLLDEEFVPGKLKYKLDGVLQPEADLTLSMLESFSTLNPGTFKTKIKYLTASYEFTYTVSSSYEIKTVYMPKQAMIGYKFPRGVFMNVMKEGVLLDYQIEVLPSMVTGYDTSSIGEKEMTITYNGASKKVSYEVIDYTYEFLQCDDRYLNYKIGDEFKPFEVTYNKINPLTTGESTAKVTLNASMISGFNTDTAGTRQLTVSYKGSTAKLNYSVLDITGLTPSYENFNPKKLYYLNEEFNEDIVLLSYRRDNTFYKEALHITEDMVTGFDTTTVGVKTIAIRGKINTTYQIVVLNNPKDKITIASATMDPIYVGDELDNITVAFKLNDTLLDPIEISPRLVKGFDSSKPGKISCGIDFAGLTDEFEIEILAPSFEFKVIDFKDTYNLNEPLLPFTINKFINGVFAGATLGDINNVRGFDSTTPGTKTLRISYNGVEIEKEIRVLDEEKTKAEIANAYLNDKYYVGDAFKGGYLVYRSYNPFKEERVAIRASMLEGFDTTSAGIKEVTISYKDLSYKVEIEVNEETRELVVIDNKEYFAERASDLGVDAIILVNDHVVEKVVLDNTYISGYDFTKNGIQTLTVKYDGLEATYSQIIDLGGYKEISYELLTRNYFFINEQVDHVGISYMHKGKKYSELVSFMPISSGSETTIVKTLYNQFDEQFKVQFHFFGLDDGLKSEKNNYVTTVGSELKEFSLYLAENYALTKVNITADMVTGFDTTASGTKELSIKYGDYTLAMSLVVNEVRIDIRPKTEYKLNDLPEVTISDSEKGELTLAESGATLAGFSTEVAGQFSATITYRGKEFTFEYGVYNFSYDTSYLPKEIVLDEADSTASYPLSIMIDNEEMGANINVEIILGYTRDPKLGDNTMVIPGIEIFGMPGFDVIYNYKIVEKILEPEILFFNTTYFVEDEFIEGLAKVGTANNPSYIKITKEMVAGFDTKASGERDITFTIGEKTFNLTINVAEPSDLINELALYLYVIPTAIAQADDINASLKIDEMALEIIQGLTPEEKTRIINDMKAIGFTNQDLIKLEALYATYFRELIRNNPIPPLEMMGEEALFIILEYIGGFGENDFDLMDYMLDIILDVFTNEKIVNLLPSRFGDIEDKTKVNIKTDTGVKAIPLEEALSLFTDVSFSRIFKNSGVSLTNDDKLIIARMIREIITNIRNLDNDDLANAADSFNYSLMGIIKNSRKAFNFLGRALEGFLSLEDYASFTAMLQRLTKEAATIELSSYTKLDDFNSVLDLINRYGYDFAYFLRNLTNEDMAAIESIILASLEGIPFGEAEEEAIIKLFSKLRPVLVDMRGEDLDELSHLIINRNGDPSILSLIDLFLSVVNPDFSFEALDSIMDNARPNNSVRALSHSDIIIKKDSTVDELMKLLEESYEIRVNSDASNCLSKILSDIDLASYLKTKGFKTIKCNYLGIPLELSFYVYEDESEFEAINTSYNMVDLINSGEILFVSPTGELLDGKAYEALKGISNFNKILYLAEYNLYLNTHIDPKLYKITHSLANNSEIGQGVVKLNTPFGSFDYLVNYHTVIDLKITDMQIKDGIIIEGIDNEITVELNYGYKTITVMASEVISELTPGDKEISITLPGYDKPAVDTVKITSTEEAYGITEIIEVIGDICYDREAQTLAGLEFRVRTGDGKEAVLKQNEAAKLLSKAYPEAQAITAAVSVANKEANLFKLSIRVDDTLYEYEFTKKPITLEELMKPKYIATENTIHLTNTLFHKLPNEREIRKVALKYTTIIVRRFEQDDEYVTDIIEYCLNNGIPYNVYYNNYNHELEFVIGNQTLLFKVQPDATVKFTPKEAEITIYNDGMDPKEIVNSYFSMKVNEHVYNEKLLDASKELAFKIYASRTGNSLIIQVDEYEEKFPLTIINPLNPIYIAACGYRSPIIGLNKDGNTAILEAISSGEIAFSLNNNGTAVLSSELTIITLLSSYKSGINTHYVYKGKAGDIEVVFEIPYQSVEVTDLQCKPLEALSPADINNLSLTEFLKTAEFKYNDAKVLGSDAAILAAGSLEYTIFRDKLSIVVSIGDVIIHNDLWDYENSKKIEYAEVATDYQFVDGRNIVYDTSGAGAKEVFIKNLGTLTIDPGNKTYNKESFNQLFTDYNVKEYITPNSYQLRIEGFLTESFTVIRDDKELISYEIIPDNDILLDTNNITTEALASAIWRIKGINVLYKPLVIESKEEIKSFLANKEVKLQSTDDNFANIIIGGNEVLFTRSLDLLFIPFDSEAFINSHQDLDQNAVFVLSSDNVFNHKNEVIPLTIDPNNGFTIFNKNNSYTMYAFKDSNMLKLGLPSYKSEDIDLNIQDGIFDIKPIIYNITDVPTFSATHELTINEIRDALIRGLITFTLNNHNIDTKSAGFVNSLELVKSVLNSDGSYTATLKLLGHTEFTLSYGIIPEASYSEIVFYLENNLIVNDLLNPTLDEIKYQIELLWNGYKIIGNKDSIYTAGNLSIKEVAGNIITITLDNKDLTLSMLKASENAVLDIIAPAEIYLEDEALDSLAKRSLVIASIESIIEMKNNVASQVEGDLEAYMSANGIELTVKNNVATFKYNRYGRITYKDVVLVNSKYDIKEISIDMATTENLNTLDEVLANIRQIVLKSDYRYFYVATNLSYYVTAFRYDNDGKLILTVLDREVVCYY